jgi:hypothetical protein
MMGVGVTSGAARAEITEEPSRPPTEIASTLAKNMDKIEPLGRGA